GPAAPRARAAHPRTRVTRALARRARIRLTRAGAGQPEPAALPRPDRLRAGELPAGPAELARRPRALSEHEGAQVALAGRRRSLHPGVRGGSDGLHRSRGDRAPVRWRAPLHG